jgi:uncharacterized protein YjbI with pentapeptide repeats
VEAAEPFYQARSLWSGPHEDGPHLVNFSRANLSKTDLSRATLHVVNLSQAFLNNANLFQADLEEANLAQSDLSGANLSEAANLTQQQIEQAKGNAQTELPEHLKSPASWS